ncbi:hypothetical protein [Streptomyces himalayensis]|uniref:Uncharacterized protein n=1 Tax=Streptomyces himalayensis subsp. himalayensis TaxID=2756131 RepID=A0A7W0DRQ8_9ACTN|nr:hypothetical protein [Streptomyces himalayensis]MBA2949620.1 hypothetical protein [Streptomyces himalayensis subsp. himalayensis]
MTTSLPRSPRLLLITTVVLSVTGMILLAPSQGQDVPAAPPDTAAPTPHHPAASPTGHPASNGVPAPAPTTSASAGPSTASALPPHGEGAAGDRVIQQALEDAWPADLAARDERQLLAAGRELLRADATGIGRSQWPTVFGDQGQAIAPAYSRFRIQAAIARKDGGPHRAVVHLVWAGADRGGTYTDGRITDLHFTRTTSKKGASTWTPQPRT